MGILYDTMTNTLLKWNKQPQKGKQAARQSLHFEFIRFRTQYYHLHDKAEMDGMSNRIPVQKKVETCQNSGVPLNHHLQHLFFASRHQ